MSVIIYSTPSCSYCNLAKDFFRREGISFSDYNVAENLSKAEEMRRKSGQTGVPVIDINGRIIVGFNKPLIQQALKR